MLPFHDCVNIPSLRMSGLLHGCFPLRYGAPFVFPQWYQENWVRRRSRPVAWLAREVMYHTHVIVDGLPPLVTGSRGGYLRVVGIHSDG